MFTFDHDCTPSPLQIVAALAVVPARVLLVSLSLIPFSVTCLVAPWLADKTLDVFIRYSVRLLLLSLGVILDARDQHGALSGAQSTLPHLLVASHVNGHLDAFLLLAVFGGRYGFVANAPVFRLPLVGRLLSRLGSVRVEPGTRSGAAARLHAALARGDRLAVFAEGGCTDGRTAVLRFRTGAFLLPLRPALPVAIAYPRTWGSSLAARGEVLDGPRRPFWTYLLILLGWPLHAAQVTVLPAVEPVPESAEETPAAFAGRVQRAIAAAGGLQPSPMAYADFRA